MRALPCSALFKEFTRVMIRHLSRRFILMCILALLTVPAMAQDRVVSQRELAENIFAAFDADNYREAAELTERFLEHWPNDSIMLYNAACAYAQLGEEDKAADYLYESIARGYVDFDHMEQDDDLDSLRDHPVYVRVLKARDEAYAKLAEQQMGRLREQFGEEDYFYETDSERKLNYVTALDMTSHREMKRMLERQADQLAATLFHDTPSYYTVIAVPTPGDAARMIPDQSIGGIYEHNKRRLIARDIGMMLRHEFTHLMHYGHMQRLNQPHALWVQEGIAALYESYDLDDDGTITFQPNFRFNQIKRFVDRNRYRRWDGFVKMSPKEFMNHAGVSYPQARSVFRWLATRGKLVEWYEAYVDTFEEDKTGALAFERVFHEPLEKTERRWRNWLKGQELRDEWVVRGDGSLGVQMVIDSINDGVEIEHVFAGSGAAAAGILPGDIIVSVDGLPTRSSIELREIIAAKSVGDKVTVRIRRDNQYRSVSVTLKPLR